MDYRTNATYLHELRKGYTLGSTTAFAYKKTSQILYRQSEHWIMMRIKEHLTTQLQYHDSDLVNANIARAAESQSREHSINRARP